MFFFYSLLLIKCKKVTITEKELKKMCFSSWLLPIQKYVFKWCFATFGYFKFCNEANQKSISFYLVWPYHCRVFFFFKQKPFFDNKCNRTSLTALYCKKKQSLCFLSFSFLINSKHKLTVQTMLLQTALGASLRILTALTPTTYTTCTTLMMSGLASN
jgi:hypothetical protein